MSSTLLSSSDNGAITWCGCCKVVQLEFGNLCLRFAQAEFDAFCNNVGLLDIQRWEEANSATVFRRKVHIQVRPTNITLVFSAEEVRELRRLMVEAQASLAIQHCGGQLQSYSLN